MRCIDGWINVNMAELGRPGYLVRVVEDYFKKGQSEFFRDFSPAEVLAEMDRLGIEKAIVTTGPERPSAHVLSFVKSHPDRFALGAQLDARRGMKTVRALKQLARDYPLTLARITPFALDLPPSDRIYLPIYVACIELDLPITVNTGIPGPPAPGECQHPLHLDRVCLQFPELKLVMAHGADPWWDVAIRLMLKYRNLYLMTSAYSPKYFPPELVHFMNTRGQDRVIFASDHPALTMERTLTEARELPLRPGVLDRFLYQNARDLFFAEKNGS